MSNDDMPPADADTYASLLLIFTSSFRLLRSLRSALDDHGLDLFDTGLPSDHTALLLAAEQAAYALLDLSGDAQGVAITPWPVEFEPVEEHPDNAYSESAGSPVQPDGDSPHPLVSTLRSSTPSLHALRLSLRGLLSSPSPSVSLPPETLSEPHELEIRDLAQDLHSQARELAFAVAGFSDEVHYILSGGAGDGEGVDEEGEVDGGEGVSLDTIHEVEEEDEGADELANVRLHDGGRHIAVPKAVDEHQDADDEDDGSSSSSGRSTFATRLPPAPHRAKPGASTSDGDGHESTPGLTDQSGTESSLRSLPPYMAAHRPGSRDPAHKLSESQPHLPISFPSRETSPRQDVLALVPRPARPPSMLAYAIAVSFQVWVFFVDLPTFPAAVIARPWSLLRAPSRRRELSE